MYVCSCQGLFYISMQPSGLFIYVVFVVFRVVMYLCSLQGFLYIYVVCVVFRFLLHLLVAGCDIGVCFSVLSFVCPSVRLSTFMSKFDIYVKVSILINYKTKQLSSLA